MLAEEAAGNLFKRYSAKAYSKDEPHDDGAWPLQQPSPLADVFREVVNQGRLTKSELVQEFTLAATDVETLSGLSANWLTLETASFIELKPRTSPSGDHKVGGNVIRV